MGGIGGQEVVEAVVAVGQGALGGGEDGRAVDIGKPRQRRVAVGGEEIVPGPGAEIEHFVAQVIRADEPAGEDRRRAGAVALVVRDHGKIGDHDLGARRFQRGAGGVHQGEHRGARLDLSAGRAADAGVFGGAGQRVGIDIHGRQAEAPALQRGGRCQRRIGGGADLGGFRDRHPRLAAPEIAARLGIVGDDDVEQFQHVGHAARMRHDHVHGRHQRPVAAHRNDAAARRIGAQPVIGGGRAAARPGFLAEPEGGEAGGGRRARAVGGTGAEGRRQVIAVIGGFGASVETALHAAIGHGRHVGQPDQYRAAGAQALYGEGILAGDEIGKGRRARGDRQPACLVAVLGGVGNAVERPAQPALGAAPVGGARLLDGLRIEDHDGVQPDAVMVVAGDSRQIAFHKRLRRHAALFQRLAQRGDRRFRQLHRDGSSPVRSAWRFAVKSAPGEGPHDRPMRIIG